MSMSHGLIESEMAEAFLDAGPLMVRHMCDHTPVAFRAIPHFPDYHAEFPGGKTDGKRSLDTHRPIRSRHWENGKSASHRRPTIPTLDSPSTGHAARPGNAATG